MPRFTIIIPTHGVPGRLTDCLGSVLEQSFEDFELIAVVDDSEGPADLCSTIVAEHAERDPRVRRTQSSPSDGLPGARNAGAAVANGQYVLFLDGDDMLVPRALAAIDTRLAETDDPDLLFFDHERVHWFEGSQGPTLQRLWKGAPAGAFSAEQHAALPDPMVPAFCGAYRRSFLAEHRLSFAPGMFTDTAWSVLCALRAERLAVLDQVCVRHLLRRQGARNRVEGAHHLDLLDQFDLAMTEAAVITPAPFVLARIFGRFTHEVLTTASTPSRLPSAILRRRFFRRASRLYRRHRPAGFTRPAGRLGAQHRLLASGCYTIFCAGRGAKKKLTGLLAPTLQRAGRHWQRRRHPYRAFLRRPLDERLAVFSAYGGSGYACNPAAIHAAVQRLAPHIKTVFLVADGNGSQHMPDGVECVVIGSRRYWQVMATAKYTFNNVDFEMAVKKRPGTIHVQTQHGTPLKRMGLDQVGFPAAAAAGSLGKLLEGVDRWDFSVSSNHYSTEVWEHAYPGAYESLNVGYPRNDVFYSATADDVATIRKRLGIPEGKTAVLYAPTHRDYRTGLTPQLNLPALCDALGEDFVVLLRAHHLYEGSAGHEQALHSGKLIDVTEHRSPEEVCLAADVLVTDYSSIMFDYANLDRPIVVFAGDWDIYRAIRGVYFDLLAEPPGAVARTQDELARIFRDGEWNGEHSGRLRAAFRERFCHLDDGLAAERVVRRVLLGEPADQLPPVVPVSGRVLATSSPRVPPQRPGAEDVPPCHI
ncbi:bifunctional glycosyltransferase family 2 protein/CDP-glycerol:glycerophosphate glycerophosphotransferase [Streptomyces sp. NBC_01283]|uniref:bifunctional glycosyltransferase/CDP-glycerol:glycerophosphate glycerophosphotransferase n=1 Tax=Streptomyces sp. NBC_01283 TaxID=2903812 RepID=UPI00352D5D58|nr:bifunctional glycosyltransferase family 2 protein/CDP-glycerol:glycerophosphate glycerophosphotransferase [Streptomyces sp. NBC_01283]